MSRAHVVIVDDNAALLRSLQATLEARGLIVHSASDGETALALIEQREPVVVILDIVLPGLNGFQLCRRLRTERPELAVLLFSGKDEPADRLWAKEVGARGIFRKPSDLSRLVDRVSELAQLP